MKRRDIKFRIYHKVDGMRYYGDTMASVLFNGDILFAQQTNLPSDSDMAITPSHDGYSLMQYTGMDDINGKEIYEGDIVILFPSVPHVKRQVVWYKDGWKIGELTKHACCMKAPRRPNMSGWGRMEVVGNVHENPELLD